MFSTIDGEDIQKQPEDQTGHLNLTRLGLREKEAEALKWRDFVELVQIYPWEMLPRTAQVPTWLTPIARDKMSHVRNVWGKGRSEPDQDIAIEYIEWRNLRWWTSVFRPLRINLFSPCPEPPLDISDKSLSVMV